MHVPCDSLGNLPCFTPILDITSKRSQLCCSVYIPNLLLSVKSNKSCICLLHPYFLSSSAPPMLITTLPYQALHEYTCRVPNKEYILKNANKHNLCTSTSRKTSLMSGLRARERCWRPLCRTVKFSVLTRRRTASAW